MYVSTESYFTLDSCEFTSNIANETSTIEVLGSSQNNNITIKSSRFESNRAIKNTLSLMYSLAYIEKCYFVTNKATSRTKNIFVGFSTLIVSGTTFRS